MESLMISTSEDKPGMVMLPSALGKDLRMVRKPQSERRIKIDNRRTRIQKKERLSFEDIVNPFEWL
jgi:hypothetical protein